MRTKDRASSDENHWFRTSETTWGLSRSRMCHRRLTSSRGSSSKKAVDASFDSPRVISVTRRCMPARASSSDGFIASTFVSAVCRSSSCAQVIIERKFAAQTIMQTLADAQRQEGGSARAVPARSLASAPGHSAASRPRFALPAAARAGPRSWRRLGPNRLGILQR